MLGKIEFVQPFVRKGRLDVRLVIRLKGKGFCEALLGERELAALVPRSLLLSSQQLAPFSLLGIIGAILRRMALGRLVRVRERVGERTVLFLSWRSVRFRRDFSETKASTASECRRPPRH